MSKKRKKNTTILLVVFIVLLAIAAFGYFSKISNKSNSNIKSVLLQIDTSKVTSISIFPQVNKHKEIKLIRKGKTWQVSEGNKNAKANQDNVVNLLANFTDMEPEQLAGTDESDWKSLGLTDSVSTKIILHTSVNNKSYTAYIGHFTYNRFSRKGAFYVRIGNDEKAYTVSGYMPMFINQKYNGWRYNKIINGSPDNWDKLTYIYSGDSSFTLNKTNGKWMIDSTITDSAKTAQYLQHISRLKSPVFDDSYKPSGSPQYIVTIAGAGINLITIKAYKVDSNTYKIHSSINPDTYFTDKNFNLGKALFINKGKLMKQG